MKKIPFTGSGVAIVTPFHDNEINYDAFEKLIEFQIANHTDAIIVCGTTGEAATMPDPEHIEAIQFVVDTVAGRVPVIAGTGSNDTAHGVHLSVEAEKLGVDGLLLSTPYYNKCTQEGLYRHFMAYAQAVDVPIIVYNVPSRTGMSISVDTYRRLAQVPNIVGAKEASGDIALAAKIRAACGDDLYLYSGNDDMIVPMLSVGGKGVISVLANVAPQQTHDICALYFEGKQQESLALQLSLMDLIGALFCEVNPIPVKAALDLMGFDVGNLRLPLCEISEKNLVLLKNELEKANIALRA